MLAPIITNACINTQALDRFCMAELINGAHTLDEKGTAVNIDVVVESPVS